VMCSSIRRLAETKILSLFGFALQVTEPHYLRHGCSGAVHPSLKTEQFTQQSFRKHHYIP
jgi:hypothetical protein